MATPTISWTYEDKSYQPGDLVTAEFKVSGFTKVSCYQFAMLFDTSKLSFVGVEFPSDNPLKLNTNLFSWAGKPGYRVKANEVRHLASFVVKDGKTLPDNTRVFNYVFKAKQEGTLSDDFAVATCCLYPPLNPIAYTFPLYPAKLTVSYVTPPIEVEEEETA